MNASDPKVSVAAQTFIQRHRLRWWEPLPWILAIGFFYLFPRHLGFGNEVLVMVLFALSRRFSGWEPTRSGCWRITASGRNR
jgi:branched-chain amino acid transport system permease protein